MFGWIGRLLGFGATGVAPVTRLANATTNVAEVFVENKTRRMELDASARHAALAQFASEFNYARHGVFDRFVDALNRLPRPVMVLLTLLLFFQAWYDPGTFIAIMDALTSVPDPLWYLLGAIVTFYFGARESHHWRNDSRKRALMRAAQEDIPSLTIQTEAEPDDDLEFITETEEPNAALDAWRAERSKGDQP